MSMLNQAALKENSCVLALPLTTQYVDGADTLTPDICRFSGHTVHNATVLGTKAMHVGKDGQGLMYFDGSGDYVDIPVTNSDFTFGSGNFTLSFWMKLSSLPTSGKYITPFSCGVASTTFGIQITVNSSGTINWCASAVSTGWNIMDTTAGSNTLSAGTWYLISLVRNGTSLAGYVNTSIDRSVTTSATILTPDACRLGKRVGSATDQQLIGYLRGPWIFKKALDLVALRSLQEETRPDYI